MSAWAVQTELHSIYLLQKHRKVVQPSVWANYHNFQVNLAVINYILFILIFMSWALVAYVPFDFFPFCIIKVTSEYTINNCNQISNVYFPTSFSISHFTKHQNLEYGPIKHIGPSLVACVDLEKSSNVLFFRF